MAAVAGTEIAASATVRVLYKDGRHEEYSAVKVAMVGHFIVLVQPDKPAAILWLNRIERMEVTPDAQ